MLRWFRASLPARAGFAVAVIATLAVLSAFSAGMIAWIGADDGAAINTAGSLRMASYRLSWKLQAGAGEAEIRRLADDLQARLESRDIHQALDLHSSEVLHQAYGVIQAHWRQQLRPALDARRHGDYLAQTDAFVAEVDHLTRQLQLQSQQLQTWQLYIQGAALLVTVVVLLIGMYEMESSVITPLRELVDVTRRFRDGDLAGRVDYRSEDELGHLALSFNDMAEAIEESHRTLEARVKQKTHHLAVANAALELLLQGSRSIATRQTGAETLNELIRHFQERLPGLQLTLCLQQENTRTPGSKLIALHGNASREICSSLDCTGCDKKQAPGQRTYVVQSQGQTLGELRAGFADQRTPLPWESDLVQALTDLIGSALVLERQRETDHQLLLMQERTTIARELHDSLAQALSYLNLQVSRLHTLIQRGQPQAQLESVVAEIERGVESAYRQLRELLSTFRLRIDEGGLDQAINDAVEEFARRGDLTIHLDSEPLATPLSASEQIHLLQIMREALSNCVRHAQAQSVDVTFRQEGEEVELIVEDDGIGLSLDFDQRQHHGITIMRERTRSLNGMLALEPRAPHGTRVHLNFRPSFLGQPLERAAS